MRPVIPPRRHRQAIQAFRPARVLARVARSEARFRDERRDVSRRFLRGRAFRLRWSAGRPTQHRRRTRQLLPKAQRGLRRHRERSACAGVLRYPELRERVVLATQSGPLLVLAGKIHPAFKPDSASRHIRNGVGVPSPDTALFVISEAPVSFYDFATLFRDKLHSPDALFLDGTISSLYAPALKRSDSRADLGPIIAVAEASAPLGQVRKSGTSHPGSPRLWRFDPGLHSGASPRLFKAQRFSKRRLKRPP